MAQAKVQYKAVHKLCADCGNKHARLQVGRPYWVVGKCDACKLVREVTDASNYGIDKVPK